MLNLDLLTFNLLPEQQLDFCSLQQDEQLMRHLKVVSSLEVQIATILPLFMCLNIIDFFLYIQWRHYSCFCFNFYTVLFTGFIQKSIETLPEFQYFSTWWSVPFHCWVNSNCWCSPGPTTKSKGSSKCLIQIHIDI